MNYIAHLNKVLNLFVKDLNLNPTHISLYMALFREWNSNRFSQKFKVQRKLIMNAAKIGSNSTYHRCINDLHNSRYIIYNPSKNPHRGTEIQMAKFQLCTAPQTVPPSPRDVLDMGPYSSNKVPVTIYKHINEKEGRPFNELEVIKFFKERGQIPAQGLKFFRYYESNRWMTSKKELIKDWKSLAETWILNESRKGNGKNPHYFKDHLQTTKFKNYDEPL